MIRQDTAAQNESLERHERKCAVCHHPDRAAIEQEFLDWGKVWYIARDYQLSDYRSIYSHAHAFGLFHHRRRNVRSVLEHILESASRATPSADAIIRAVRAYTRLDDSGNWIEPPTRVVFSVQKTSEPAVVAAVARDVAAQVISEAPPQPESAPDQHAEWDGAPLQVGPVIRELARTDEPRPDAPRPQTPTAQPVPQRPTRPPAHPSNPRYRD